MPEGRLSDLIGRIYDAAFNPSAWTDVLGRASEFVGGGAASIHAKDMVGRTVEVAQDYGIEAPFRRSYVDEYAHLDPSTSDFSRFGVDDVVAARDVLAYEEFLDSRFYKEWARPQGWIDAVTSVLEKSATGYAAFTVFRHERNGLVDEETRRRMRLLVPHVRRAVLIGKTFRSDGVAIAALADTLDSVVAAVFLVDPAGRLMLANEGGDALLADASALRLSSGCLVATDAGVDQLLQDALAATADGYISPGRSGVSLPLPAPGGRHCVAHVLSLTAGARRRTKMGYTATAAIFVQRAQLEAPAAPEVMASLYGLTPSELRVLLAVFEAGGVADIAKVLGISPGTAKTHLRHLFDKTGTKRQAELVKLVAGFAGRTF